MVDTNYVFVYLLDDMPVNEMVTPCAEGYTIYINAKLDHEHQVRAYEHALKHIEDGDFDVNNMASVQEIESKAHELPARIVQVETELERLRKNRKKRSAAIRKKEKQIKFLQDAGLDLFNIAEDNYLYPPNL